MPCFRLGPTAQRGSLTRAMASASTRLSFVVLACLSFASARIARADDLTLERAIAGALATHERAKIAEQRLTAAEADVEGARSDFLPSLTLGASATARPAEDARGRYVTGAGTLTLNQPLLRPSAIPRLSSAQHTLEAQKHSSAEDRRALAFDAARSFLDALAAERFVEAAESRLLRARANLDNAQARVDAELNGINDVTRAKLEVSTAQREVVQRKRDRMRARIALEVLTGTPTDGALSRPESLFHSALSFAGEPVKLTQSAVARRDDLKSLNEQVLAARDLADEPSYRLIPAIDLTGQLRVDPDPATADAWHEESLTVSLSWPIFDGGQRYADRKAQVAKASVADLEKQSIVRALAGDVRRAVSDLDAARDEFKLADQATVVARASTEETLALYQQGLARAIELTDANAVQFDSDIDRASSRIEMARSFLEVRFALGLEPLDAGGAAK